MRVWNASFLTAISMLLAVSGARAQETDIGFADRDDLLTMPITPGVVVMCHGYNCRFRDEVTLSQRDFDEIAKLMKPAKASASAERAAVAKVMAWFDRRVGPEIGTAGHLARAGTGYAGDRRQFDCIDTTHNTTLVLRELERLNHLAHHRVAEPASRLGPPLHSTAVLAANSGGGAWAIDGWTRGYGELPDVMPLREWLAAD
jgi:hypothetical protein